MNTELFLVTGAGGFVGGFMVDCLVAHGVCVRAMVRDLSRVETRVEGVEYVEADLSDADSLRRAVDGVTGVYHIAALFREAGHPDSMFYEVNLEGTRRLLDASIEAGVRRFIHCSTVGVLGHIAEAPADEQTPCNPGDIYQQTKMEGEQLALGYFNEGKIDGVVIRPAMIYGPGDSRTLKLFRMIAKKRFFYVGKGQASVHWIDVRDLVEAFYLAMQARERTGGVYIIAGERALPLKEMADKIAHKLGVSPPWLHLPVKPMQWLGSLCECVCKPLNLEPPIYRRRVDFFTKDRHFDGRKAQAELGFIPARTFDEEVADIITSYKAKGLI
ncbi:MAG: dihydroflavonol-4-reductase [Kiritimatiellia bacterium]|jgi:dihydroflavonol-4-reductase